MIEHKTSRWQKLRPEHWRADLLRIIQLTTSVLGSLVCIPSVYFALQQGIVAIAVVDVVAIVVIIALTVFQRIDVRVRAAGTSLVFYGVGVGLLIAVGPVSQIYLFAFSLLTTLLMSVRAGLVSVVLNAITMTAAGAFGIAHPEMGGMRHGYDLTGWLVVTGNFVFLNVSLVAALGAVLAALESALSKSLASTAALKRERADLVRLNTALETEVAQRARNEAALQENRALLRIAGSSARLGGWRYDLRSQTLQWSEETRALHGLDHEPSIDEAIGLYEPAGRQLLSAAVKRCAEDGTAFDIEAEVTDPKDAALWFRVIGNAVRDVDGTVTQVHGSLQDITSQKTAELRHAKLEAQLLHAQKMDAVGSLAGGIAHDFNNLLSVILGYAELIVSGLPADDAVAVDLQEIIKAGERASKLTKQLLAFSRKQILQPTVLELNPVVVGVEKMLVRVLGEHVKLTVLLDNTVGKVWADEGQLEQVLLNLVVNARDAMTDGGNVTIETASVVLDDSYAADHAGVVAGRYVMLAVTDTGVGMDKATQARIFEPFFTTKDKSKGTGLGLSTVYGIVQQSGGHIWVYSEPGQGTTFKIYLPRTDRPASSSMSAAAAALPTSLRGTETILLVEDEEQVRDVMRSALRANGYNVLEAQNGGEAFLLCEQFTATIHLMVTDVVMPRMSGRQLAERLAPLRPEMSVLYVSGYTENTIVHHGVLDAGIEFLPKPVTPMALLTRVRQVLDQRAANRAPSPRE